MLCIPCSYLCNTWQWGDFLISATHGSLVTFWRSPKTGLRAIAIGATDDLIGFWTEQADIRTSCPAKQMTWPPPPQANLCLKARPLCDMSTSDGEAVLGTTRATRDPLKLFQLSTLPCTRCLNFYFATPNGSPVWKSSYPQAYNIWGSQSNLCDVYLWSRLSSLLNLQHQGKI